MYALPQSDHGAHLSNVYNCLIEFTGSAAAAAAPRPFPRQFEQWNDGCFLHEPIDAHIQPQINSGLVYFKVSHTAFY